MPQVCDTDDSVGSAVSRRQLRAHEMIAEGRRGHVRDLGDGLFSYHVQTTGEFDRNRWPLDAGDGYRGYILMKDGRLVDGQCSCPDEGAEWRGFMLCKHMVWASYRVKDESYEVDRVELWLEYDFEQEKTVLARVGRGGQLREAREDETLHEKVKELESKGFTHIETGMLTRSEERPFWVIRIYTKEATV